jgi:O-acetyl-ADP-ribose deacetylase
MRLVLGDITDQRVDAIVNAANAALRPGGGVDGAIHRAGGPAIEAEARRIGGCPTGGAVATTAGDLHARYVIHAVGPVWRGGNDGEPQHLASAYRESVARALELECRAVAFPAISTGVYGYPLDLAAAVAVQTVAEATEGTPLDDVRFVLFDQRAMDAFTAAVERL